MVSLQKSLLLFSLLMSGFSGIVAELSLFNIANSLLGGMNIVLSYTMGVMMFCMGLGSFSIKFFPEKWLKPTGFMLIESLLSVLVAFSVSLIFYLSGLFPGLTLFWVLSFSAAIGYLIGFEIPLILIINDSLKSPLKDNSATVLFADYLGSLLAFMFFSHFMLSHWGIYGSALFGGGANWLVAFVAAIVLWFGKKEHKGFLLGCLFSSLVLLLGLIYFQPKLLKYANKLHYRDPIIFQKQTEYQNLVLSKGSRNPQSISDWDEKRNPGKILWNETLKDGNKIQLKKYKSSFKQKDIRLFINGGLQFSTLDEYYYHELLVHPAMYLLPHAEKILIAGAGDGLALRELVKYPTIKKIDLVELDPEMTQLFKHNPLLCELNDSSLYDSRLIIYNQDAFNFIKEGKEKYDLIIFDFPDPHHDNVAKLYSLEMYSLAKQRLKEGGILVTQSTSPFFSRKAFLSIYKTMNKAFPTGAVPLHISMPSFGEWAFCMAANGKNSDSLFSHLGNFQPTQPMKYLSQEVVQASLLWSPMLFEGLGEIQINLVSRPILAEYYNRE